MICSYEEVGAVEVVSEVFCRSYDCQKFKFISAVFLFCCV